MDVGVNLSMICEGEWRHLLRGRKVGRYNLGQAMVDLRISLHVPGDVFLEGIGY